MTTYQYSSSPIAPPNNNNHSTPEAAPAPAPTLAERHREARQYARPSTWAKLRPWLLAGAFGLLVGGAAAVYASYQVMPPVAHHVTNVFVTIDGRPAVILSGDVVYDTAPLSSTPAGQP